MDIFKNGNPQSLLNRQLAEVLAPLDFGQEPEEPWVCTSEAQERLRVTTHYLHLLCPPTRRLTVLAEACTYLRAHHGMSACVSQGTTEDGRGFLVFASQKPFQDVAQTWLTQQLMVDGYRSTVSVDIDLS